MEGSIQNAEILKEIRRIEDRLKRSDTNLSTVPGKANRREEAYKGIMLKVFQLTIDMNPKTAR